MGETDASKPSEDTQNLLRRFELPLLQFATRITGDRERARDVVQETFVKFQRNGASSHMAEPATWLFTVCRNAALNVCRKEKRMLFLDEEILEARQSEELLPREQLEQKGGSGVPNEDFGNTAAAATGSHPAEISK